MLRGSSWKNVKPPSASHLGAVVGTVGPGLQVAGYMDTTPSQMGCALHAFNRAVGMVFQLRMEYDLLTDLPFASLVVG